MTSMTTQAQNITAGTVIELDGRRVAVERVLTEYGVTRMWQGMRRFETYPDTPVTVLGHFNI